MLRGTPDGIAAPARPSGPRLRDDPVRPAFLTAEVSTPTRGPGQFSTFFENSFVRCVKRRLPIRIETPPFRPRGSESFRCAMTTSDPPVDEALLDGTVDLEAEVPPADLATRFGQAVGVVLVTLAFVAIPVGLVFLGIALYPDRLPSPTTPDFIDNIFDNRAVIWAARLLLVSAAVVLAMGGLFTVVSTIIRMKNREWLKRAGPFEVSENALTDLEAQIQYWRNAALIGQEEIAELRERLEESDELIKQLHLAVDDG